MIYPVAVSTWHGRDKYFDAFIATAKKNGIDPQNADPEFWPGTDWRDKHWFRKTEAQYRFVTTHPEFTHFMFTDAYDICFAAGWEEIMEKYRDLNSPLVFGSECYPWPKVEQAALYPETNDRCKYLNAGFWIGEAEAAKAFLLEASEIASRREQCDQGIFVDLFLSKKYPIKLDTGCSLLFCCNIDSLNFLESRDGRPTYICNGQKPCVFHGNGASDLLSVIRML